MAPAVMHSAVLQASAAGLRPFPSPAAGMQGAPGCPLDPAGTLDDSLSRVSPAPRNRRASGFVRYPRIAESKSSVLSINANFTWHSQLLVRHCFHFPQRLAVHRVAMSRRFRGPRAAIDVFSKTRRQYFAVDPRRGCGRPDASGIGGTVYRGPDAASQYCAAVDESWDTLRWEVEGNGGARLGGARGVAVAASSRFMERPRAAGVGVRGDLREEKRRSAVIPLAQPRLDDDKRLL